MEENIEEISKEELPKPILIRDLGKMYPKENSKCRARLGIYICGFCGNEFRASFTEIKHNKVKSCGCYRRQIAKKGKKTTHGLIGTRLYQTWTNIKERVLNPNSQKYVNYGGRGITICPEWKNDFMSFYNWAMENEYSAELTIDRIDNDGNYCPENCRWTTKTIQSRNQRILKRNTTGYRGVSFSNKLTKFKATISVNYKNKHLGYFPTAELGAIAYNNYIIENNLEGFILNKIPDSYIHLQLPNLNNNQTFE